MRWEAKPPVAEAVYGDKRTKKGFLFFPKRLLNPMTRVYEWRWLEVASWIQTCYVGHGEDYTYTFWESKEWVT